MLLLTKPSAGFTLIELLVVVLIIGILASVALPQYTKAVEKSRATQAITSLENLSKAQQAYLMSTGSFTNDTGKLDIDVPMNPKDFAIAITSAEGASTFSATATRQNAGTPVTGANAYALTLTLQADGTVSRTCSGAELICKTIGNDACSVSDTPWCYSGASAGSGTSGHSGNSKN